LFNGAERTVHVECGSVNSDLLVRGMLAESVAFHAHCGREILLAETTYLDIPHKVQ
jgi:hypothetical protein